MLIRDLYEETTRRLAHLEDPRVEARYLVAHLLGCSLGQVILRMQDRVETDLSDYYGWVAARAERVPMALILGEKEFYGRVFRVAPGVLIPRDDTERLMEAVLGEIGKKPCRFLEIGVGSGILSVTLLAESPASRGVAVDISEKALALAAENAERLGVSDRLTLLSSDLYGAVDKERFDLILSNPPYIPEKDRATLMPEVVDHDPHEALFAGADGLDLYRRLVAGAPDHLEEKGLLALEIGHDQAEAVMELMRASGFDVRGALRDYGGHDRVLIGRYASNEEVNKHV